MKIKSTSVSLVVAGVFVVWFAWNIYDYNYGRSGDRYVKENCASLPHEGFHFFDLFRFIDCPHVDDVTNNQRQEKYRVVAELAVIHGSKFFLGCRKEGDCTPSVMEEYENGAVSEHIRGVESIKDINYKISPDKKKIVFLHVLDRVNSLYLYDLEKQVGKEIKSDVVLKANETVVCEVGSYGMDPYSCGAWLSDNEYIYGIYSKSALVDTKFKLIRTEKYIVR